MNSPATDPAARERLRAELEAIDGVHRAFVDGSPLHVLLVCREGAALPVEPVARALLAREGIGTGVEVQLSYLPGAQPQRRVRFVRAELEHPSPGRAVATVELEWEGRRFEERQEGESGSAVELRLAALTAIRAVDAVIGGAVGFHLVGIKAVRAFDADLVVALLRTEQGARTPLIGATVAGESQSPARAAALAVLNATNRVLGNFLATEG